MARRYHVPELSQTGALSLPDDVAQHLARVMRVRVDDRVRLFDGRGQEADARITEIGHRSVTVVIETLESVSREPKISLELAFCIPRAARAEWIIEHGTELGIAVFRPIIAARSRGGDRRERWDRVLRAAAGQCDRSNLPEIRPSCDLGELLDQEELPEERLCADTQGPPMAGAKTHRALLLVGPEGGFNQSEREQILDSGFTMANLGPLTLRTETAALAGATLLLNAAPDS
ncbi:MAG: RsmE family RNA methyltransferase [Planctomycetota bacterium]|jgi:16S rRNA (uracil1498-N3)-methyltransferase|nr:RsmE family RNA methyltransferase [Planctomycetota bacterium]